MTPRQRVLLALSHKEADRVPIDLGGTIVTSVTKAAWHDLRNYLHLPLQEHQPMADHVQQLPYLEEDLLMRLHADVRMVQMPAATAAAPEYRREGSYYTLRDRWGATLKMPVEGGLYFDWTDFPVTDTDLSQLRQFDPPPLDAPEVIEDLRMQAARLRSTTEYAVAGSGVIGGGIFEQGCRLMGMEAFMMAMAAEPAFAESLMDMITDIYIASCDQYLDRVGEFLDVFTYWDDVMTQQGWMISPEMYRRMIKPRTRRLADAVRKKTDAKLFYHACGAAYELLGDIADIGFDIVNPVQVSAAGMDTSRLKRDFGKDLVFWGGGVDTQRILPEGTVQQVEDEVKRRIHDLAPGGGFVFAAVHNIQAFVPPQNIIACFDSAVRYGGYR